MHDPFRILKIKFRTEFVSKIRLTETKEFSFASEQWAHRSWVAVQRISRSWVSLLFLCWEEKTSWIPSVYGTRSDLGVTGGKSNLLVRNVSRRVLLDSACSAHPSLILMRLEWEPIFKENSYLGCPFLKRINETSLIHLIELEPGWMATGGSEPTVLGVICQAPYIRGKLTFSHAQVAGIKSVRLLNQSVQPEKLGLPLALCGVSADAENVGVVPSFGWCGPLFWMAYL